MGSSSVAIFGDSVIDCSHVVADNLSEFISILDEASIWDTGDVSHGTELVHIN